jgi:arginyl-tRNA synthetase
MLSETSKFYLNGLIAKGLLEIGLKDFIKDIEVLTPQSNFGDYSTNVALVIGKKSKQNPKKLAESLIQKIKDKDGQKYLEEITEINGFINFKLSKKSLLDNLESVLDKKEKYGQINLGKSQKILVEYFQPNIAKPLHLGHLRTAIIGDSLFRILKFEGFDAQSDTHLGDWGTQFGLLILGFKKYGNISIIEKNPIEELNKLYVKINAESENNPEIRELGKAEFVKLEKADGENRKLWKQFTDWSWKEFEIIYEDLDIRRADHSWPESFFEDKMPKVLEELKSKNLLVKSQGAQIIDLSAYNLGVAVAVKSDGGTTYLLRDLATYIFRKSQGFEKQIYVVDVRQSHTLAQTFKILELMGHIQTQDEAIHIAYGFLTLPTGAMSTRKGTIVGAKEFIESVQKETLEIIKEKNPDLKDKDRVSKIVASSAIKYFDLLHNLKSDIVFDPKQAVSFEGKTGPYLQYAHARIHGILRKNNFKFQISNFKSDPEIQISRDETFLLRKLNQFPEIIEQVATDFMPNILSNYLFELSQNFNTFYESTPVLQEKDEQLKLFKLNLISAVAQVLKNGLNLLGIEAPEEM